MKRGAEGRKDERRGEHRRRWTVGGGQGEEGRGERRREERRA